ncbi:ABC transporter permease [Paenibacillus harenae]|uniref:Aldouronate transport system permease protein n=1 Tax=Paenibacillus harenae TaxID=306543 RepID=A0ABT9U186_PAEHA|nr:ABC transporter permease subunit [Paenibacillus harenae]MDQ0113313.1 putative aldouronate transport system permease protein [Paenibacillus harenae]
MAAHAHDNRVDDSPLWKHVKKEWKLYSFLILPLIYFAIFKYAPMIGNIIAFRKYRGGPNILGSEWVGFQYFQMFMKDPTFWRAFFNDLTLSVSYLVVKFPLVLIFALLLNEIRWMKWKKFVQTVSYLPHFISMVIVAGMVKEMVSLSGPINAFLAWLGYEPIGFISLPEWFSSIYVTSGVWQSLGLGTILYLAAMTAINTELYEAARIDGASRFRLALHVTIPGILPTVMVLLILDIGSILGSNFEKILLLYNPLTYETADVISTYVYRMGITGGNFSYATAVGLFEGIIGLILVTIANEISKRTTKSSLW